MPPKRKGGPETDLKTHNTIREGLARMANSATPAEEPVLGDTSPPSNLKLKNLILKGYKGITEKTDGVAITVALLRQDMDKMRERVKDLSARTNDTYELLGTHTTKMTGLVAKGTGC
ncbi:hypothetical protein NDU88_004286 [Pleurodeles waltl]|uniref:Uncharacterized protein n=1 Tax=Pleurodeles waltl TaxID=8319 RepID=A0AAV7SIH4_PLEWA|nr:hypothetical protein NDU88_004286 [Pleurodeles waltl]